tara:strand:+ start:474 stop:827 length:354 start_codon:yes stop_codon:yes gene_type:complete
MQSLNVGKDFSSHPIGRYRDDGPESGEVFREDLLIPKLKNLKAGEQLEIVLDDEVEGYGSSFLVEAFAGVVKVGFMSSEELLRKLTFIYSDEDFEFFEKKIKEYISEASFGSAKESR